MSRSGEDDQHAEIAREPEDWPESGLTRRTLLRTAGAASVVMPALVGEGDAVGAVAGRRFFSAAEQALVEELAELIIPADGHSPGARDAGATAEIDRRLADLFTGDPATAPRRRLWREGLRRMAGAPLLQRLTEISRNELSPRTPDELFFVELKREVCRAYYTSEVGVLRDLEYKGNSHLEEYVGHDAATVPLRTNKQR